jgi:hypothetical protein
VQVWCERWRAPDTRLRALRAELQTGGERVRSGGPCDRWDLEVAGGMAGVARIRTVVEEHGRGRQLVRHRVWPRLPRALPVAIVALGAAGTAAASAAAWLAAGVLVTVGVTLLVAAVAECGIAMTGALRALGER